jgi:hypothetical protein
MHGPARMRGQRTVVVATRGRREGWMGAAPLRNGMVAEASREARVGHGETEESALPVTEVAATANCRT